MTDLSIKVDLSEVLQAIPAINAQVFPLLHQAVGEIARAAHNQWKESVFRARLWTGEKTPYLESINWKFTGEFDAEVWTDYGKAREIDDGRPERDLKKMLNSSTKVRLSKNGKRYLIIPFRHNVPGANAIGRAMPQNIYDSAHGLSPSRVTGKAWRSSGTGATSVKTQKYLQVRQRVYAWGDRLPEGMAPKLKPSHKTDPYAGMVRFDTSGKVRHSGYMTFRVMSENSQGWIVPPKPGLQIVKNIVDGLQPRAEEVFSEAIRRTLG